MNTLRSFVNCEVSKPQLLASLEAHAAADNLIKGTYWENGKGCAAGCSIRDFKPGSESNHELYEPLFGLPEGLAGLEDFIFVRASDAYSKTWPIRLISAIPVGSDLTAIAPKLHRFMLTEIVQFDVAKSPEVKSAIDAVVALIDRKIAGDEPSQKEWSATSDAAADAAAESVAWSVAWSVARSAAWSAARSAAWSVAWSAAESAAAEKIGDELIRLLGELEKEQTI
jgi:hypothetical protein